MKLGVAISGMVIVVLISATTPFQDGPVSVEAILRGYVHELDSAHDDNTQWLEVIEYSPAGNADEFVPSPECWMPFTQGGLLLHPLD